LESLGVGVWVGWDWILRDLEELMGFLVEMFGFKILGIFKSNFMPYSIILYYHNETDNATSL
jgi:hypothetical protein